MSNNHSKAFSIFGCSITDSFSNSANNNLTFSELVIRSVIDQFIFPQVFSSTILCISVSLSV
jgi:hypothetical protein